MTTRFFPSLRVRRIFISTSRLAVTPLLRAYTTQPIESPTPLRPCPKCSTPLPLAVSPCPNCSILLEIPHDLSLHSLLNLSQPIPAHSAFSSAFDIALELSRLPAHGYDLDPRDLRQRMLTRQKELHPDKFSSKGENEVGLARELSGRINDAFAVLVDPLRRAEYILSAHALATLDTDSEADPELLAEILEAREELESATSVEAVEKLRQINRDKVQAAIESIKEAFTSDPPNLTGAKILAVQLKYWQGLEEAAKEWTPNL